MAYDHARTSDILYYLSLWAILVQVDAQSSPRGFIEPPGFAEHLVFDDNHVFTLGDDVDLRWKIDQDAYSVVLWQQNLTRADAVKGQTVYCKFGLRSFTCPSLDLADLRTCSAKAAGSFNSGTFRWTVDAQEFDVSNSHVFFFCLVTQPEEDPEFTILSHYFNLTNVRVASTLSTSGAITGSISSSASSPSTYPTSSSMAQTGSADNTTQTAATNGGCNGYGPLNCRTTISIGVGLGIGLPLALVVLYMAVTFLRRSGGQKRLAESRDLQHDNTGGEAHQPSVFDKQYERLRELCKERKVTLAPCTATGNEKEGGPVYELPGN